jgi:hypothetical protein
MVDGREEEILRLHAEVTGLYETVRVATEKIRALLLKLDECRSALRGSETVSIKVDFSDKFPIEQKP